MRGVVIGLFLLSLGALAGVPLREAHSQTSVYDYAHLLDDSTRNKLDSQLQKSYHDTNREVVVVLVASMEPYGFKNVEGMARSWSDQWHLASQDILFLVSLNDRKCRIQLGKGWPSRWDGHCVRVLDKDVLPAFKAGAYAMGVQAGCQRLLEMESAGPDASPPAQPLTEQVTERTRALFSMSDIPRPYAIALIGVGLALLVGGFVFSQNWGTRLTFAGLGVFVIVAALCTMVIYIVLIAIVVIITPNTRRRHGFFHSSGFGGGGASWGGGGSFGGGGGSFGGGGGATGSW